LHCIAYTKVKGYRVLKARGALASASADWKDKRKEMMTDYYLFTIV
jgi:hypothetical protein